MKFYDREKELNTLEETRKVAFVLYCYRLTGVTEG